MEVFNRADILLPDGVDMLRWSVVACDQYTSQPEYWQRVERVVGDAPSTLRLVYPEAYLAEGDARIEKINAEMKNYLASGIFKEYKNALVYIERTTPSGVRCGLVGAVDLEAYDYRRGAKSAIRATEGTVLERIPPRVKIRRGAALELPHIMLLADDTGKILVEPLADAEKTPLYDFELMENGGHLRGWLLSEKAAQSAIAAAERLAGTSADGLLFAVGDGNHSLASAKAFWEEKKQGLTPAERETDPARYCLVEVVNIHSPALEFEPIHRVVFGADADALLAQLEKECGGEGHTVHYITAHGEGDISLSREKSKLAVGVLQDFLDKVGAKVDYIHGEDALRELSAKDGCIGFMLPKPDKSDLFASVIADGALPRKTFSMGEAYEKRFYTEARKIEK